MTVPGLIDRLTALPSWTLSDGGSAAGAGRPGTATVTGDADRARLSRYAAPDSPPFLIVHGDADRRVGLGQGRRLHAALREHGAQAELIVVPGADHADPKVDEPPVREAMLRSLAAALVG